MGIGEDGEGEEGNMEKGGPWDSGKGYKSCVQGVSIREKTDKSRRLKMKKRYNLWVDIEWTYRTDKKDRRRRKGEGRREEKPGGGGVPDERQVLGERTEKEGDNS